MTMLVRIKPYNPKRGQLARRVVIGGYRFDVERGWYEVDEDFAEQLREETLGGDPNASKVFDVCTKAEAEKLQASEDRAAKEASRPDKPLRPERVERVDRASREGKTTTTDIAAKSAAPILVDGADEEDEEEIASESDEDEGRVAAVGRLPGEESPAKPAPKSRRAKA